MKPLINLKVVLVTCILPVAALVSGCVMGQVLAPAASAAKSPAPGNTPIPAEITAASTTAAPTSIPSPTATSTASPTPTPPAAGATETREADGMVMVYVPAGQFLMGPDNLFQPTPAPTPFSVTLDGFWIDRTEVTNDMFAKFIQASGFKPGTGTWGQVANMGKYRWNTLAGADWQHPQGAGSSLAGLSSHPVVQVNWNDARAYCQWAGAQLPSEAQWEKAARGTDGRIYPWGNGAPNGKLLNFADVHISIYEANAKVNDGYKFTAPVGSYPAGASPYGALDMAGNVNEWTSSLYMDYPYNASDGREDLGNPLKRVVRGGSWYRNIPGIKTNLRVPYSTEQIYSDLGFRCLRQ